MSVSSAETRLAFTSSFDTVNLHRLQPAPPYLVPLSDVDVDFFDVHGAREELRVGADANEPPAPARYGRTLKLKAKLESSLSYVRFKR